MNQNRTPNLLQALLPIGAVIFMLFANVAIFDDPLKGPNQIALLIAATIGGVIAWFNGIGWDTIQQQIISTIKPALPSVLILFLIGGLSGIWMFSGIIPTMIYYGIDILDRSWFLAASVVLCSIVSIATGSSWTTIATVGVAVSGIGTALGFPAGVVAGAIISGAYFGDKMSPLSDTTNLAPAIAGTDLFTHIRYMSITTVPALVLTLLIFGGIGLFGAGQESVAETAVIRSSIAENFNVTPLLLLVPLILVMMIIRKIPAIPTMIAGILMGTVCLGLFQPDHLNELTNDGTWEDKYQIIMQCIVGDMSPQTGSASVDRLLSTSGMGGMLDTVWLVLVALAFGGVMEAGGYLQRISGFFIKIIRNNTSLVGSTMLTCIFFNMTACDQYLSIVVPGKMMQKLYDRQGLKPEVLSRALEDSATVTSPLIPWNTCGATQAKVLGVATLDYLPFCFFNLLSPLINILITAINFKIRKK